MNKLFFGDNLDVLRRHIEDESADLIYLDPPFNSKATYNVLYREQDGTRSASQIKAFEDTWQWDNQTALLFQNTVEAGGEVAKALISYRQFMGENDMLAYLTMMAPRLVELRRVLKSSGSIYLHCDPTASHYLKMLMDGVFGPESFRNEVIWKRTGSHNSAKRWGPVHDVLLFYTKSTSYTWNNLVQPYEPGYIEEHFRYEDEREKFQPVSLTGPGTRQGDSGSPLERY